MFRLPKPLIPVAPRIVPVWLFPNVATPATGLTIGTEAPGLVRGNAGPRLIIVGAGTPPTPIPIPGFG